VNIVTREVGRGVRFASVQPDVSADLDVTLRDVTVTGMAMIPIACSTCGALSQIDEAWLGQWVECPHCGKATLAAKQPSAPTPPPAPQAAPPKPPRPLTRDERQAIRRRRHLIVAIASIVVLVATVFLLLALRG
jgi:hypothetical protein